MVENQKLGGLLDRLGLTTPIIQAPMAGGATTPALLAAVSNAGALGSLGAAYLKPDQITEQIAQVRALTSRPFNVNIFAGGYTTTFTGNAQPMLHLLSEAHAKLGIAPPQLPTLPPDPFHAQLDAILQAHPAVVSFTFGIPIAATIQRIQACGILVIATATTAAEAEYAQQAGADAVVAQGSEAGARRGTFLALFDSSMVPTLALVEQIRRVASIPVIASGGLMDGRDIARCLALGAVAVQLGTAFLACPECGISPSYKQALLSARTDTTVVTRAYSGRPARGLVNEFIEELRGREDTILPYPLQNALTRPMRNAAAQQGEAGYQSLWAGQGVARMRAMGAAELVRKLTEELHEAPTGRTQ